MMGKTIFMVPNPDTGMTIFLHEIEPDFSGVVYSEIQDGVAEVLYEKAPAEIMEGEVIFFADRYIPFLVIAKAYAALNGIPEEMKKKLMEGKQ